MLVHIYIILKEPMLLFNNNYLSSVSTKYIQVYTAVIEGMSKRQKCAKNSINITIPNGAVVQTTIKAKKN